MSDEPAVETPAYETVAAPEAPARETCAPVTPVPEAPAPRPRRRGPGPFTLLVLPGLVTLTTVAGFLALTGGLPDDWSPGDSTAQDAAPGGVDASYGPWLRKSADACTVVTPSALAAQIDQLTGWSNAGATASGPQGIAAFTAADWKTWGKDDDGNGRSSPSDPADAIMALGRQDCSLARQVTDLRTDGTVNGDLVDLTLAAYAVGTDAVTKAGGVPASAQTYLGEVKALFAKYEAFDREDASAGGVLADAILAPPVTTLTITSPYGSRQHPLTGVTKLHTGVDFGAPQGAQVSAARAGTVVFAAMTTAYGNRIVVDHGAIEGKRLQTTYSHLSAIDVTVGQAVQTGTPLGRVGSTGLSTGPHLHFEVIYDGYYSDPRPWLALNG
ncbi:M23 family metallopeptidase [Streptomyces sp. SLBN-115]|uniref:M23 family metallopeptidase n=1 Tax=Streptomyces sp. SLBN-115 TaxID=2768453 RepID=UPI00114E9C70|nr:M23 family metallopeptidase [Streptomyces sp. SLBN-115]TQJ57661.1 peptidase M23-like protein [Streptomyces sp. SLBN-115]